MANTLTPDEFEYLLDQIGGRWTNPALAKLLDVSVATIGNWKRDGFPRTMAKLIMYDALRKLDQRRASLDLEHGALIALASEMKL